MAIFEVCEALTSVPQSDVSDDPDQPDNTLDRNASIVG